jgi:molecular chaperone GrpE
MTTDEPENQTAPAPPDEREQLKAQAAENWDKFLRATADFDNYRKRVTRERDELVRATRESVINALLPALDNLERALDHSEAGTPLHEGLLQVQKQFERALADFGVTEVVAKPGDAFDPAIHEAVSHIESPNQPENAIVEQLHSAYKIGDRLLRPARVVVSKGPSLA